MPPQFRDMRQG